MSDPRPSDTLVFFGATGDLAYKQIFPAVQALVRRAALAVPIIGVARSNRTDEQLRERARDSLEHHGGVDRAAFDKLARSCATSGRTTPIRRASSGCVVCSGRRSDRCTTWPSRRTRLPHRRRA